MKGAQSKLKCRKRFASLLSTDRVGVFESEIKDCRCTFPPLLECPGLYNYRLWSGIIVCGVDWIGRWDIVRLLERIFLNAVIRGLEGSCCLNGSWTVDWSEMAVRDCFDSLQVHLKMAANFQIYNFFIFSIFRWLSTFDLILLAKVFVAMTPWYLICSLVL